MSKDHHEEEDYITTNWEKRALHAEREVAKLREINDTKLTVLEHREKIDTRTNILRVSLGLNTGLIAGLLVHFLAGC